MAQEDPQANPQAQPAEQPRRARRGVRRWLWFGAVSVAFVLLLVGVLLGVVLYTGFGAKWALSTTAGLVPGLDVARTQGVLGDRLVLHGVRYRDDFGRVEVDQLTFDWAPWALLGGELHVQDIVIDGLRVGLTPGNDPQQQDQPAAAEPFALPALPLVVQLDQFALVGAQLSASPDTAAQPLPDVRVGARWADGKLVLQRVSVEQQDIEAQLTAALGEGEQGSVALDARATYSGVAGAPVEAVLKVDGDLQRLGIELELAAPYAASVRGRIDNPLTRPRLALALKADGIGIAEIAPSAGVDDVRGSANVQGVPDNLVLDLRMQATTPSGVAELSLGAAYAGDSVDLRALRLSLPDIGAGVVASGQVQLKSGGEVDAAVRWTDLKWPVGATTLHSASGSVRFTGAASGYELSSKGELQASGWPAGGFELSGRGDAGSVQLPVFELRAFGGVTSGNVRADWSGPLQVSAALDARDIDPSWLAPAWPGQLRLSVAADVRGTDTGLQGRVDVEGDGQLRGLPVVLEVAGDLRGADVELEALKIRSGSVLLGASGVVGEASDLTWQMQADNLGDLLPGAAGELSASGALSGRVSAPRITLQASGTTLGYGSHHIARLQAEANVDLAGNASRVQLSVDDVTSAGLQVASARVTASGTAAAHEAQVSAQLPSGDSFLSMQGRWEDPTYAVELRDVRVGVPELGPLQLVDAVSGEWSQGHISWPQTCLAHAATRLCATADTRASNVVLEIRQWPLAMLDPWLPVGVLLEGELGGDVRLRDWSDPAAPVGEGRFDLRGVRILAPPAETAGMAAAAKAATEQAPEASDVANAVVALAFADGSIAFDANAERLEARLNLPLRSQDDVFSGLNVQASAATPLGSDSAVTGELHLALQDLRFLGPFLPTARVESGHAQADFAVSGTASAPKVAGQLVLADGRVFVPDLNATFRDTRVELRASETQEYTVSVRSASGEGWLNIEGSLRDPWTAPTGNLQMTGEAFEVMNTPVALVSVSPEVRVEASAQALAVTGRVAVPVANIVLNTLPPSARAPSKDQIIVTGEPETSVLGPEVSAELELVLGEDVTFKGQGLDAKFSGDLTVYERPGEPTTATGQITVVKGTYQAYGQDLLVEDGQLIWTGGSLAEPGLDVLAARIPKPDIWVGVRVRGSLSKPKLSLTSRPAMSESNQLAYLILGRPMEESSSSEGSLLNKAALALGVRGGTYLAEKYGSQLGFDQFGIEQAPGAGVEQAALVVGKYLTPRLYVSYGLGLLESVSTFKMQYLINSSWSISTQSSAEQSGGDIVYTIER